MSENIGFKISLPGYDVKTATPEQCVVHSSYPPFKAKLNHCKQIKLDFTAAVAPATTHTVYSEAHGYSYTPFVLPALQFRDSGGSDLASVGSITVGATLAIRAFCDATNFYITVFDDFSWTSATAELNVSMYLFCENGA